MIVSKDLERSEIGMETKTVIDIKNVKKKFKGFELSIPDLQIPQGFATALIGENGAGKSTLLNILAGIRLDYKGELRFFDGTASDEEVRERIGYTASSQYFLPHWDAEAIAEAGEVLYESFSKEENETDASFSFKNMLLLAIATSIDALAVGVTFALLPDVNIFHAISLIGITTFILSAIGIKIGSVFGMKYKSAAELTGGIILILMGTKILLEHLGVISF